MLESRNRKGGAWRLPLAAAALLVAASSWAQWELDGAKSAVNFVSIKNASVAETHGFGSLLGYISADGTVQLSISLDSVATSIPIRDQRIREVLFETVEFPTATVTAAVDPALIAAVAGGGTVTTDLPVKVALHGVEQSLSIPVLVIGEADGRLQVFTPQPVLLNASAFGLAEGIEALREIAGLNSISAAVPVSVRLVFNRAVAAN